MDAVVVKKEIPEDWAAPLETTTGTGTAIMGTPWAAPISTVGPPATMMEPAPAAGTTTTLSPEGAWGEGRARATQAKHKATRTLANIFRALWEELTDKHWSVGKRTDWLSDADSQKTDTELYWTTNLSLYWISAYFVVLFVRGTPATFLKNFPWVID